MPNGPSTTPAEAIFADTNLFLRYLTNDVPEQASAVEALLRRAAAGQLVLVANSLVLAEIIWTLESFYRRAWLLQQGVTQVYTFDRRHFSRMAGITVLVPGAQDG